MKIAPFRLERYFACYEFSTPYLLSSSDCEALSLRDLLSLAGDETRLLWEGLKLGYTESAGLGPLREEVACLYHGVEPEQVLIVVPEEGIFLAMNAILGAGDHVICTFPGYQSLYEVATALGCELTLWRPMEEEGWRFTSQFLVEAIRPNTKLVVCNFPHNPTGYLPAKAEWQRIVDACAARGITLFSDEMYRLLELSPADRLPSAVEEYDRAVSLSGMSKVFGMAGVRLGWLVTRDEALLRSMAALKDYTTICSSAPSEILSLIALRAREEILRRHRELIARNLRLLDDLMRQHPRVMTWVPPQAGTVCFPRLLEGISSADFCRALIQEAGIMLLPSTVYDYDDQHVRIGVGRASFPEVLARFGEYLDHNPQYDTR